MKPSRHSGKKLSHTTRCWIVFHPFFTCTGKISFVCAKRLPVVWWSYDDEAWQKHAAKRKGQKKATESHLVLNNFSSLSSHSTSLGCSFVFVLLVRLEETWRYQTQENITLSFKNSSLKVASEKSVAEIQLNIFFSSSFYLFRTHTIEHITNEAEEWFTSWNSYETSTLNYSETQKGCSSFVEDSGAFQVCDSC